LRLRRRRWPIVAVVVPAVVVVPVAAVVAPGSSTVLLPPRFEFFHGTRHVLLFSVYAPLSVVRPGSVPAPDRNLVGGIHHVADSEHPNGGQCFEVRVVVVAVAAMVAVGSVAPPLARKYVVHDAPHEPRLSGKRDHRHLQAVGQGGSYQVGVNGANVREELLEGPLPAATGVNVQDGLVEIQCQEIDPDVVSEVLDNPLDAGGMPERRGRGQPGRRRCGNAAAAASTFRGCRGGGWHAAIAVAVAEILVSATATAAGRPLFRSSVVVVFVVVLVVDNSN